MTKEDMIVRHLIDLIESGRIRKGGKLPSAQMLAARYSVNKDTANKALTRLVERGWVERRSGPAGSILIRDSHYLRGHLGYCTNLLSAGRYGALVMRGAQNAATTRGYILDYHETVHETDSSQSEWISNSGVKGILSCSGMHLPENCGIPCVHLGVGPQESPRINYYYPDRESGARRLAEFAIMNGHVHPALLMGVENTEILSGITHAYSDHGLSLPASSVFTLDSDISFCPEIICTQIRHSVPDCTLIFCASDSLALRLIIHLREKGIRVPEDISVTGFGTMQEYQSIMKITSAEEFPEKLGYRGCLALIDLIEGRRDSVRERYSPEIIQGETMRFSRESSGSGPEKTGVSDKTF